MVFWGVHKYDCTLVLRILMESWKFSETVGMVDQIYKIYFKKKLQYICKIGVFKSILKSVKLYKLKSNM